MQAAPLMVNTLLTTESVHGEKHKVDRTGVRMNSNGFAKYALFPAPTSHMFVMVQVTFTVLLMMAKLYVQACWSL